MSEIIVDKSNFLDPQPKSLDKRLLMTKIKYENIAILFLFIFSINDKLMMPIIMVATLYFIYKSGLSGGSVKILIFISFRSILNPGLTQGFSRIGIIKWLLIFLFSGIVYIKGKKVKERRVKISMIFLTSFAAYVIVSGVIMSGYPVISAFKVFSWIFVLVAVIKGIYSNNEEDWISFLVAFLNIIVIVSPFTVFWGVAYLRNGYSFQGLTNQPNMLGIVLAITFAVNLYLFRKNYKIWNIFMLPLCIIEGIFTKSRGCLLWMIFFSLFFFIFNIKGIKKKTILSVSAIIILIIMLLVGGGDAIRNFIFKGQITDSLLVALQASRGSQVARALEKFSQNMLWGTGFMVPINPAGQSFVFSFDLVVEPGNIIMMLLGDLGIIGSAAFVFVFTYIYKITEREEKILFFVPFCVCMSEMNFFSTNNLAIVYYFLFAVCITSGIRNKENCRKI